MPELSEEAKKRIASLEKENQKLEKEVVPLYTVIGKNYYEKPEGHENEMERAVSRLDTIKKQIHENRIAILKWKGIRLCPNCGSEVEQGAIFCGECGIRMEAVEDVDENSMLCSRCGAKNEKGKKFCVICGQKLVDIVKATEEDTVHSCSTVMTGATVTTGTSSSWSQSETALNEGVTTSTTTGYSQYETTFTEEETVGTGQAEVAATAEEGSNEANEAAGIQEQECDILAADTAAELATASDPANVAELPQEDVIFCPECGNKLPADALFCGECGARIAGEMPEIVPQESETGESLRMDNIVLFCPECGNKLPADALFCTECGAKIEIFQEPSAPVDDMPMFCPECGTKLSPGSAFCTECGAPIQAGR